MFENQDIENGNIDIIILNNLENKGSIYFLDIINNNKHNPNYSQIKIICQKYFLIFYVENLFSLDDIFGDLFDLIHKNEVISLDFIKDLNNDFKKNCLSSLFSKNYDFSKKLKLYNLFLNANFNDAMEDIEKSLLGILFQENIDIKNVHDFIKSIVLKKENRVIVFNTLLRKILEIRKEYNELFISDSIKELNKEKFIELIRKVNIMKNMIEVFLLFWNKGINPNRLKQINETYIFNQVFDFWSNWEEKQTNDEEFNFLTHCFFMIHTLLDTNFKMLNDIKTNLSRFLHDLEDFSNITENKIFTPKINILKEWKAQMKDLKLIKNNITNFAYSTLNWMKDKKVQQEELIENCLEIFKHNFENIDRFVLVDFFLKLDEFKVNTYIKNKYIEIIVNDFCNKNKAMTQHQFLVKSLVTKFIEMEKSCQFHEKFGPRFNVIFLLNVFQLHPNFKEYYTFDLKHESEEQSRFLFLLFNDIQYYFEELIENIKKIRKHEKQESQMQPGEIIQIRNMIKSYIAYGMEYMKFVEILSQSNPHLFTSNELVDKVAIFLDFLLQEFAGPNTNLLKVNKPEELYFEPVKILSGLGNIFINLSYDKKIIPALSNDRQYNSEYFNKMVQIIIKKLAYDNQTWFKTGLLSSLRKKII